MAFTSGLASGLQAGAQIGFGIRDRKRRAALDQKATDRQAFLDQRYNDTQATNAAHYQDKLAYQKQAHDDAVKAANDAAKYRTDTLGLRKQEIGMKKKLFANTQQDRLNKQQTKSILEWMQINYKKGATTPEAMATKALNEKGALTPMSEQFGVTNPNIHRLPQLSADGQPNFVMTVAPANDPNGSRALIGKDGVITNPDAPVVPMSMAQLQATVAHHKGWKIENAMDALTQFKALKGKMTDREKMVMKNKNALKVANAKRTNKQPKVTMIPIGGVDDAGQPIKRAGIVASDGSVTWVDSKPAQPQGSAPQAAIDYLKANPGMANAFKMKYGYIPEGM